MITLRDNQVLKQLNDFNCDCGDDYKQPLEAMDLPQLVVDLDIIGSNYIDNGTFASSSGWTLGANWAIASGKATYTSGATNALTRTTDISLVSGYYLIKFDYTTLDSGRLNLTVSLGGVTVSTLGGALGSGFPSQTFYLFKYLTPSTDVLSFSAATYNFEIDNVEVYRLSEPAFDVKDCDTNSVEYQDTGSYSVSYYNTGNILNGEDVPTITQGYAIVTLYIEDYDIPEGCYKLCFNDAALANAEFIRNGDFNTTDHWTINNTGANGWAINTGTPGSARHIVGGTAGNDVLSQDINLDGNLCYELSFDVSSFSGLGSKTFTIEYDTADSTVTLGAQTVSSFPTTLTWSIEYTPITKIKIICDASGLRDASISNITLQYTGCEQCVETTCFSYKSDWDTYAEARKMCNIKITGYNSNSAFGFPSGYSFIGRVFGKIRNSRYPDVENTEYRDLSGVVSLQYNDNEKVQELQIYEVPERVHDWLRLALRSQSLTLNINDVNKTYVKVGGDYTPNWRKTSTLAPVIVEIKETQQVAPNMRNV